MALLDALGDKLVTDGVGTLATNIFLGYMPDSPDTAVAVYESRGNGPEHVFGASVVSVERPQIRVIARAPRNDYPSAKTKILAVRTSLGAIRNQTISGIGFLCVEATSEPYPLRADDQERPLFAINFVAWVTP